MFIQWDGDVCIETVFEPDELVPSEYAYKCAARESWLHLPEGHRAVEGLRYMRRMTPDERKRYLTRFRIVVDGKAYEMENVSMHELLRQWLRHHCCTYKTFSIEIVND